jgi:Glycosyltransferase family 87
MVLWAIELPWSRILTGHNDFLSFYTGGMLAGTSDLYSTAANRALNEQLGFSMPAVQYLRPPYYAACLKALTIFPYAVAYWMFQVFCLVLLVGFAWAARRKSPAVPWLVLISIPVLTGFANGQDVAIILALSAAAVYLDDAKRPWLAGLCLALCTIKFHLFVFTPIALLVHRKWRFAGAAALGVILELAGSFAIAGRHWPWQYAEFLRNPALHPAPYTLPNVFGIAEIADIVPILAMGAFLITVCLRAKSFKAGFVLSIFGALLAVRHSYIQDYALVLLIPLFLQPESSFVRQLSLIALTPFPYFLLLAEKPLGMIAPLSFLLWFAALAADQCALLPRRKPQTSLPETAWSFQ